MELGAHVLYHRYEPGGYVVYPASLLTLPDGDGRVQLFFYHPDRSLHTGGSDWRNAIDRAVDVPTEDKAAESASFWGPTTPPAVLPSAADLDVVADEEKAKEATADKSGPRIVKGSKAK